MNLKTIPGLDKPLSFKDSREQTVVYVVIIAYYWKLNGNLIELYYSNHAVL